MGLVGLALTVLLTVPMAASKVNLGARISEIWPNAPTDEIGSNPPISEIWPNAPTDEIWPLPYAEPNGGQV